MDIEEGRAGASAPAAKSLLQMHAARPAKAVAAHPRPAPRRRLPVKRLVLAAVLLATAV